MKFLRYFGFAFLAMSLAACGSTGNLLSSAPDVGVIDPMRDKALESVRSRLVFVEASDVRASQNVTLPKGVKSLKTVSSIDNYLRDGVSDGLRKHGFRFASVAARADRKVNLEIIQASYRSVHDGPVDDGVEVKMRVRTETFNKAQRLMVTYEYTMHGNTSQPPTVEDIERLASRSLDAIIASYVNDEQVGELLAAAD